MLTIVVGFATSAALAILLTFGVRFVALRIGAVDRPDGGRKIHTRPIATVGGTGVWLACVVPVLVVVCLPSRFGIGNALLADPHLSKSLFGLFIGGTIALALGFWDDLRNLRARKKLLLQVAAATIAWAMGLRIGEVDIGIIDLHLDLSLISYPLTLFWFRAA